MTTPGENHYSPRPDRERPLPDRPRPHADRPRGRTAASQSRRLGGRGLITAVIAVVIALMLIAGAAFYFVSERRSADNNAADPLRTEEGNYVIKPCAAQGDDIPRKLEQAIDAVKNEKTTRFIDGMKVAAFIAHNQQVTEDLLVDTLQGRRPETHYYGHGNFSESDYREMVRLLGIDYELENRALVQEVHDCLSLDAGDTKEVLDGTEVFAGIDETLVDEVIDNGGPETPRPQVLVPAPDDVPEEFEDALNRAREILAAEERAFSRSNRVALFLNLMSGSRLARNERFEEGKKYSVDAAMYAAEHVDAEYKADHRADITVGGKDLDVYTTAVRRRTAYGESIPQIAARGNPNRFSDTPASQ